MERIAGCGEQSGRNKFNVKVNDIYRLQYLYSIGTVLSYSFKVL